MLRCLFALIIVAVVSVLHAQEPAPIKIGPYAEGIKNLTAETLTEALDCGSSTTVICEPKPPCASINTLHVSIYSPFKTAMAIASAAASEGRKVVRPTLASVNGRVELHVSSVQDLRFAQRVTSAMVIRGSETVEPVRSKLEPVVLQNAFGATVRAQNGVFTFPITTFAPTTGIRIRINTESGAIFCEVPQTELANLR